MMFLDYWKAFLRVVCVLVIACVGVGCTTGHDTSDSSSNNNAASNNSGGASVNNTNNGAVTHIDLTAAGRTSVAVGAQISISATVSAGSVIHPSGIGVSFATTAGTLSSATATTDNNGVATVTLAAPEATGSAVVSATAQGVPASLSLDVVAGAVAGIGLAASPVNLAFARATQVTVNARDSVGNPVSALPIQMRLADNASGGVLQDLTVTTDGNGRATTMYTAGSTAGMDVIRASAEGVKSNNLAIAVDPGAVRLDKLALKTGAPKIVADGHASTFLRAALTASDGKPAQGIRVSFNSNKGSLSNDTAKTDAQGIAEVELTAPPHLATAQVTAAVGGLDQTATVDFVAGPAAAEHSSITANPSILPADGSSTATVTVVLGDAKGNPVAGGTQVTLLPGAGTVVSANPAATKLGRAQFTLQAPQNPTRTDLRVRGQSGLSTPIKFGTASTGAPATVQISAKPKAIAVSGVGQAETAAVDINALDTAGNPINEAQYHNADLDNIRVSLVTRPHGGEFLAGTNAAGKSVESTNTDHIDIRSHDGTATFNLQSGTRPGVVEARVEVLGFRGGDFSDAGGIAARASVPQVTIASGPPNTLVFTAPSNNARSAGDGVYTRDGTVFVTDKYGNAVRDGTPISLGLIDSVIGQGAGQTQKNSATLDVPAMNFYFDTRCPSATNCDPKAQFNLTSTIVRDGAQRAIEGNDRILITNAPAKDKARFVAGNGADGATTVTAHTAYLNDLQKAHFVIGASLLGAEIEGLDAAGNVQTGSGKTSDGRARFRLVYPANADTIRVGCLGRGANGHYTTDDKRFTVPQSAQVFLVAGASQNKATGISANGLCFQGLGNGSLTAVPSTVNADANITLTLTDGGGIRLPFVPISATRRVTARNTKQGSDFAIPEVTIDTNQENKKKQTDANGQARAHQYQLR